MSWFIPFNLLMLASLSRMWYVLINRDGHLQYTVYDGSCMIFVASYLDSSPCRTGGSLGTRL